MFEVRVALGMSMRQLSLRMGAASPTSVAQIEAGEVSGGVTLRSLQAAADALECDLVYGLVPRSGSLAEQSGLQPEMLIVGDQIVLNTSSTQEALEEYLSRGYDAGKTVVFGDAAGHHSTTLSDYATLRAAGFSDIRVPRKNPPVLDRVAALNGKLKNTRDQAGVLIHPKCSALIEDLARVGFKPGTRRLDKSNPALTHASDALGYCVVSLWPVHKANKLQIRQESY